MPSPATTSTPTRPHPRSPERSDPIRKETIDMTAPILVKVGDEVSVGSPILLLTPGDGAVSTPPSLLEQQEPAPASAPAAVPAPAPAAPPAAPAAGGVDTPAGVHAGPAVRRTARELGVDLAAGTPTGPKGRITKDELLGFLKGPA